MACREGCKTKDHASYAECLRAGSPQLNVKTGPVADMHTQTKKELAAYRAARVNGIQPESTHISKVRAAEEASRLLGRAYNASSDPPANMIVNKKTAKFTERMRNVNSE